MRDVVLLIAVLATAYSGFALLALSQARHWHEVTDAPLPSQRWLRLWGSAALVLALALALMRDGPAFGAVLWVVIASISAIAVALTLSGCPGALRPLVRILANKPGRTQTP
jgi:hypothetical protein